MKYRILISYRSYTRTMLYFPQIKERWYSPWVSIDYSESYGFVRYFGASDWLACDTQKEALERLMKFHESLDNNKLFVCQVK
jgi:hypothetical protein